VIDLGLWTRFEFFFVKPYAGASDLGLGTHFEFHCGRPAPSQSR